RSAVYLPLVVFAAGAAALGLWRRPRGARAIAAGTAAMFGFSALSLVFSILHLVSIPRRALDPRLAKIVGTGFFGLVVPPGMSFVVPGIVTLLLFWWTSGESRPGVARRARFVPRFRWGTR